MRTDLLTHRFPVSSGRFNLFREKRNGIVIMLKSSQLKFAIEMDVGVCRTAIFAPKLLALFTTWNPQTLASSVSQQREANIGDSMMGNGYQHSMFVIAK